uniref:Wsv308-like protein n=1 Tax=Metopaulias depressus WSSV-like virus TaxID=1675544 RepID=A0A0K0VLN9_9VIRU|nr:wsv308-like protein [Metopaulias depressus WSSV-like virus]
MAVRILENYMKTNAAAVLTVVESVEKLRTEERGILSPEEATAISVAMYGAPPKPAAGNVASIVFPHRRKRLADKSMADGVLMSMSVARYGIENSRSRAEAAAENISKIMEEITTTPPPCIDTLDRVFVGLNDDNTPRVDCTKYKLKGDDKKITQASFQESSVIDSVEKKLKEVLSEVLQKDEGASNTLKSYIKMLANNTSMTSIISWANGVEIMLKEYEGRLGASNSTPPYYFPLISRHASKVKIAVKEIMSLVGKSYCRTATQLTSAQDISRFQKATDTCYTALMAETHERIVSNLLFYVNFKIVEGNEKDYVKNRLGAMAGTVKEPISIERRDAIETLFGLGFMFKLMPPEFVDSVLTFPLADLSYHGRCGTRLTPLLNNYDPRFEDSWARFKDVLSERSKVVRMLHEKGSRIDYVDATANLTGPVYVLVLDVANAFQTQRMCAYKLLNEIKDHYRLWNKFAQPQ